MTTVYADVLVFLNTVIDYVLLLITAAVGGRKIHRLRLLAAAFLGGAYSLILLLPALSGPVLTVSRLLSAALITAVAFPIRSPGAFLYQWGLFYLAGFLLAGAMTALWFIFSPRQMLMQNGVVYFHLQPAVLILGVLGVYLAARVVLHRFVGTDPEQGRVTLILKKGTLQVKTAAMTDTGNRLSDPFTGCPLILCSAQTAEPFLPAAVKDYFGGGENAMETALKQGIRFVPYEGVGTRGFLPMIELDEIQVSDGKRTGICEGTKAAVTDQLLFGGRCGALLHPGLAMIKQNEKGGTGVEKTVDHPNQNLAAAVADASKSILYQRSGKSSAAIDKTGRSAGFFSIGNRSRRQRKAHRT